MRQHGGEPGTSVLRGKHYRATCRSLTLEGYGILVDSICSGQAPGLVSDNTEVMTIQRGNKRRQVCGCLLLGILVDYGLQTLVS